MQTKKIKKKETHQGAPHTRAGWMISAVSWWRYPSLGISHHDVITDTETLKHHGRERVWGVCQTIWGVNVCEGNKGERSEKETVVT